MAKYSNVVEYNIVTDVDSSGIIKLQNELTKLKQSLKFDKTGFSQLGFDDNKIDKSIKKVNQLQTALTAAFNPKIGTLDLSKLNTSLQKEHTSLQMIVKDWEQMGTRGTMAISNLSNALLSMNKSSMNVNTTLSKIANTFSNTVRWGITASIFQEMMSSVQGAVSYMKNLDESLTQIQMVTNSSKENMRELAQYANNAAQALGSTTVDYTNAVKVFVQEGFSESESKQYANLSTKLANVSEQSTAVTSDQITAFRNAFQLDYEQTVAAMDKVANVANNTASNVNELMTASQRAASVAQAVGASQDSFLASIATIESVTRQSAEEIGNGLKTIYQRFADIKVSGSTEDGVDYGQYAKALKQIGVDVLDAQGEFKGMDQILKETQEVWSDLSETMKVAVGEKVAGKFQYNRFAALMNNPEYYQKALGATQDAEGMMDQMNEHYMNSIEGRLNTLQAASEQVMSTLFDQDSVEPIIGRITELVNGLNDVVTAVGGLNGLLPALSAIMLRTFSTQIAGTISNIASSIGNIVSNTINSNNLNTSVELLGLKNYSQSNGSSIAGKLVSNVADNYDQLSIGTQEKIRDLSQQIVELEEQKNGILKEQEQFFKNINDNAIEEKNLINQQIREYAEEIKLIAEKQKLNKATTEETNRATQLQEIEIPKLREKAKVYRDISKEVNEYVTKLANGEKLNSNVIGRLSEMKKQADRLGISINNLEELMERLDVASNNLRIGDKMVDAIVESATLESNINNMIKGLSGFTSIGFGISMISETFRVLGDETTSLKEKLDAVVINGLMGVTMLIPGIMQSVGAIKELGKAWEVWRIQQAATLAVEELFTNKEMLNIALRGKNIKAIALESLEQGKLNKEKMIGKLVEAGYTESVAKQIATKTINLGIDKTSEKITTKQIIGTGLRTAATETLTAALIKLGIAEEFANTAAGPLGIALAAIVVVAGAAFAAVNQMAEAEEKRKQQLQEQVDASNQVIQKLNETKEGYDTAYDSYKQTGVASEDLKNKSIELAEALKIEGAQVLVNAEMYDELNEKIQQAAINQREYNNALLEQQIKDLDKENRVYNYNWQDMAYGSDGSLVGVSPTSTSIPGEEVIANKKRNIEETEKEIATIREQLLYLDNTSEGYAEQRQELEDLIKTKQEYLVQNKITENQQKELDSYRQFAENSVNINKDIGLFDNVQSFQQVIDMLKEDSSVSEYLSMLGEEEANAWIQSFVEQILINKPDILEAFHLAITPDQNAKYNFNDNILQALGATYDELTNSYKGGFQLNDEQAKLLKQYEFNSEIKIDDEVVKFGDYLRDQGIESVEDFAKALADSNGELFKFNEVLGDIQGAVSLSDLDYEYEKSDKTSTDTENYNKQLDKLTEEAAEAYDIDLEDIIDQAKAFREELNLTEGAARELAIQNQRMTKGIDALYEGWEKWLDILQNSDHAAKDYIDASQEATKAIADLVGASDDLKLSDEFFESAENLNDIAAAAEGDIEAINRLGVAVGKDLVEAMEAVSKEASGLDSEQAYTNMVNEFNDAKSIVMSGLDELQSQINSLGVGEDVYSLLGGENWVNALNLMAEQTQMSVEQMNSLLNSIGVQADVTTKSVQIPMDVPQYEVHEDVYTDQEPDPTTGQPGRYRKVSYTVPLEPKHITGWTTVAQINTGDDVGTPPTITYTGNGPVSRSSTPAGRNAGGGGGKGSSPKKGSSSKPKNAKSKDYKTSEWDYLTDITNDLDRAAAAMEKLTKLEDRLYGKDKISNLKKIQKEYAGYITLLNKEAKIAERHAKRLRNKKKDENGNLTVKGYADQAGIKLQYDKQGNIDNGRNIEIALLEQLNQATENYNKHRNEEDTSSYEDAVDKAQKNYDGFLNAFSEYEKTLSTIEEAEAQAQEYREKLQDAADEIVDAIQEGIDDIKNALEDRRNYNKTLLDWRNNTTNASLLNNESNFYQEGLANFFSNQVGGMSNFEREKKNLIKRQKDAEEILNAGTEDADKKKLSQAQVLENLQNAAEALVKDLETAIENYNSLADVVSEASDKMDELIDNRLEAYDNIVDTLDSRLDQLALLFGDNYVAQAQLYDKKIDANMGKLVDINTAIEAKQTTIKSLKELEKNNGKLSVTEQEILKKAQDEVTKLQKEQISTETNLLQDIRDKLTSETNASMKKVVNDMFGGNDVEWISQQWELATRNSNQYLDDYNRAFEIQKLQLKYQELLNDSQHASALTQQRITDSMNEQIGYLQNKKKISEDVLAITEYDVKYAEKQLEILQKQIALEEAQNNKSQMRLQRDAAGNYSFVYGTDEDAVNQATQALLAAQQEAYNMSKQIYQQTYEEAYEAALRTKEMIVSIATDSSISVEERSQRIQEVLSNLNEFMVNSSSELGEISINLYNEFIEAEDLISEENFGHLTETFEAIKKLSESTHSQMEEDVNKYANQTAISWDSIENRTQLGWENVSKTSEGQLDKIKKYSGAGWTQIGADVIARLNDMSKGTKDNFLDNENSITKVVGSALQTVDKTFVITKNNSISSVESIQKAIETAKNKIVGESGDGGYLHQYQTAVESTLDACGSSYDSFIEDSLKEANSATGDLNKNTKSFNEDLKKLNGTIFTATQRMSTWKKKIDNAFASTENLIPAVYDLETALGEVAYRAADAADELQRVIANSDIDVSIDYTTTYTTYHNDVYSSSGGGGSSYSNSGSSYSSGGGYGSGTTSTPTYWAVSDSNGLKSGKKGFSSYSSAQTWARSSGIDNPYIYQYDTGGYTGTWSDKGMDDKDGKLALLHQKELVLNQEDTKNMLSAVEIVRDIMSDINSTASIKKVFSQNSFSDTIEQRVEINATFPGVTEAIEIKQALEQLADNAYQVANKYKY